MGVIDLAGTWTDERVTKLRSLWEAGLSCSQIAAELGAGISRNAVIGKVCRLGISGRAKPSARPPRPRAERTITVRIPRPAKAPSLAEKIKAEEASEVAMPSFAGPGISLNDLNESNCHWPKGDWSDIATAFCGGKALTGLPYCASHCRIAYATPRSRARPSTL